MLSTGVDMLAVNIKFEIIFSECFIFSKIFYLCSPNFNNYADVAFFANKQKPQPR